MSLTFRIIHRSLVVVLALALSTTLQAQTPAADPTDRLREVLPVDVADRVIARIAAARSVQLPTQALENRALKFAARGIAPADIERAINEHADRLGLSHDVLRDARTDRPQGNEVEAAAEAMRQGVDGESVSDLAKSAPSGRSLVVPLFVLGNLVERGLASDAALARVLERLTARASDAELGRLPGEMGRGAPEGVPTDRGAAATPARPESVPTNAGRPVTPPAPRRP
jgi:hypothetical protein